MNMPERDNSEAEALASGRFTRLTDAFLKSPQRIGLSTKKRVKAAMNSLISPSLVDKARPYFSGIAHFGISSLSAYWNDPFHTLLNLPWPKFILFFFGAYLSVFVIFAVIYYFMTDSCIEGKDGYFSHALWLSSRTASTIGYDEIRPSPDCVFTNLMIILEVILSSLVDFILLGVVFARFSAPYKRASTVRFSNPLALYRREDGYWCLKLRVVNIRKHQILQPKVRAVITAVDSITPSNYMFDYLELENRVQMETNIELGFPANVIHVIKPGSPLYNSSLQEVESRMMEVLVFVDGVDAMTSRMLSARRAYSGMDMRMCEQFVPLHLLVRSGKVGLDFVDFDRTEPATDGLLAAFGTWTAVRDIATLCTQLRHQTFRRLAESPAMIKADVNGAEAIENVIHSSVDYMQNGGLSSVPLTSAFQNSPGTAAVVRRSTECGPLSMHPDLLDLRPLPMVSSLGGAAVSANPFWAPNDPRQSFAPDFHELGSSARDMTSLPPMRMSQVAPALITADEAAHVASESSPAYAMPSIQALLPVSTSPSQF